MFRVRVICSLLLLHFTGFGQESTLKPGSENLGITRLALNSDKNEYAPVLRDGKLLFTSDNAELFGVYFTSVDSLSKLSYIYSSTRENDTVFSTPERIEVPLNKRYNSSSAWIDTSGNKLYFTSNQRTPFFLFTSKQKSKLHLFSSALQSGKWSKRTKLPFCEKQYNYTHPYFNQTEDTLYFASDCAGGFGAFDLYFSVLQDNEWSAPVNLGPKVNTAGNEIFPSYTNGKLVFSSDRPGGFGGLDLYLLENGQLYHFGAPMNSEKDDFGYSAVDSRKGYFSSNRDGSDDIYFYHELFPVFEDCKPYKKDPFCFTFFEEDTDDFDDDLKLEYVWTFGDGSTAKGKEARHCFAGYGEYLVELNIVDYTTSDVYYNQTSYPFEITRSERLHIEGPDTIPTGEEITFTGENSMLEGKEIVQYFWQLDENGPKSIGEQFSFSTVREGMHEIKMGVKTLDQENNEEFTCIIKPVLVVKDYHLRAPAPLLKIEDREIYSSKNDSAEYTLFLGVDDTLFTAETFNGKDTLHAQALGDSLYLYSVGVSADKISFLQEYRVAKEMGFPNSQVVEIKEGEIVQAEKLSQTQVVELEKIIDNRIEKEQIITSIEIYYEYRAYTLTEANRKQLKSQIVNYPLSKNQRVLISSFTDSKGDSAYNLELSKKRSLAVRDELIKNGYPVEQIELEFYGKRVPVSMEPLSDAQRRKSLIIVYEIQ